MDIDIPLGGAMSDYVGRKRIAYISFMGHTDFLEAVRIVNGWEWIVYDGALGRVVADGKTGIKAITARQNAEKAWREYRRLSDEELSIKWRY